MSTETFVFRIGATRIDIPSSDVLRFTATAARKIHVNHVLREQYGATWNSQPDALRVKVDFETMYNKMRRELKKREAVNTPQVDNTPQAGNTPQADVQHTAAGNTIFDFLLPQSVTVTIATASMRDPDVIAALETLRQAGGKIGTSK